MYVKNAKKFHESLPRKQRLNTVTICEHSFVKTITHPEQPHSVHMGINNKQLLILLIINTYLFLLYF